MFKYLDVIFFGFLICAPLLGHALDLSMGGSMQVRYEYKSDFNFDDSKQDYALSQLRLNAKMGFSETTNAFVELQDARVFGEDKNEFPPIDEDARNQSYADELDIHQAYIDTRFVNVDVRAGRQKFNLGDKRLVASLEWVNTARVNDGLRLTFGKDSKREIQTFISRLVSVNPNKLNNQSKSNNRYFDSKFHGAFVNDKEIFEKTPLEYWFFYRENDDFNDEIYTLGVRVLPRYGDYTFDLQGSLQTGDFDGLDHRAAMLHLGVNRDMAGAVIGAAYNWASGDDDPNDSDHGTFDNLYPLNHVYYGYMDLFSLQNIHNFELSYTHSSVFGQNSVLRVATQSFWLDDTNDAWYNAGLKGNIERHNTAIANDAGEYVGSELDITLKFKMPEYKTGILLGVSLFFTGDYVSDTGPDKNAFFAFVQVKKSW